MNVATTSLSTISSTLTTTANNTTIRETVVATVTEPPAWIFGAAGDGFVALLIGAVGLAWCGDTET